LQLKNKYVKSVDKDDMAVPFFVDQKISSDFESARVKK